jgi:hypothetical protein
MNKVTKRMATIAGIGMVAVIVAVGVTFVSAQKAKSDTLLLATNVVALAQTEDPCNDCQYIKSNPWCVKFKICYSTANGLECCISSGYRTKCNPNGTASCTAEPCDSN